MKKIKVLASLKNAIISCKETLIMNQIEEFYNKFNEDKRLKTRHGQVEYRVTMHYVNRYIEELKPETIADIGAGAGAYTVPLLKEGHSVIAIDLVQYNLGRLKQNVTAEDESLLDNLTIKKRNAMKLREIDDNITDITLLLGPMYHLDNLEDRRRALSEAIRITRPGGVIFVAYIMNEYAILMHGFNEHTILNDINTGNVDALYKVNNDGNVYSYVRLDDIDDVIKDMPVKREVLFSPDGAANHLRPVLNSLSDEEFEEFVRYQLSVSARPELLGASAHTVDVLSVT